MNNLTTRKYKFVWTKNNITQEVLFLEGTGYHAKLEYDDVLKFEDFENEAKKPANIEHISSYQTIYTFQDTF